MTALHGILQEQFANGGDAPAVLGAKNLCISYRQLATAIGRTQQVFQARKVSVVGVLSTRRAEAYIGVLAAFFSGVRFVPMNPDLPLERLEKISAAARVDLVLCDPTTRKTAEKLPPVCVDAADFMSESADDAATELVTAEIDDAAVAYQMFTSGSTGDPKGVPVTYDSLSHYVTSIIGTLNIPRGGHFSQLFDLSFDLSLHDVFVGLACAGALCPASKIDLMMPHAYLAKKQIDVWFSVPMLAALAVVGQQEKPIGQHLSMALFCGEALPTQYAAEFSRFIKPGGKLYNLYGPTEATIAITAELFDSKKHLAANVALGNPFGANRIAIETETGEIVACDDGTQGELLLGGPQVFAGYDPKISADIFLTVDGIRYYRSGDLVRVESDALLHLGRTDNQIKLRGYRIELGDIEAAIRTAFGVSTVAAVVLGGGENREIGAAYVQDETITDFSALSDHLPDYMVPARWMKLDDMPVNINGKIDRKALRGMTWDI